MAYQQQLRLAPQRSQLAEQLAPAACDQRLPQRIRRMQQHGVFVEHGGRVAHLRRRGAFADQPPPAETLLAWLSEPMPMEDRSIRYRFAGQKARYLSAALETLAAEAAPQQSGRILRDWLTKIPGIGFKTASWVARNWLDADDVAILDIHILRAGVLAGFFDAELTVERHYRELEDQFLTFSAGLGVRASELDALMWYEMMASRNSVAQILSAMPESAFKARHAPSRPPANPERPHARQLALIR